EADVVALLLLEDRGGKRTALEARVEEEVAEEVEPVLEDPRRSGDVLRVRDLEADDQDLGLADLEDVAPERRAVELVEAAGHRPEVGDLGRPALEDRRENRERGGLRVE